jgi:hypothetical protein
MKYLGIPLNASNLGVGAFSGLVDNVAKRVPPHGKVKIFHQGGGSSCLIAT